MNCILVSEDMSGADERLTGFKYCEHLGVAVLRKNNENVLYYRDYISESSRKQALEVARQLVTTCKDELENGEIIVARYMFEGLSTAKDVREELYYKKQLSGSCGRNDKEHNVCCSAPRLSVNGDFGEYKREEYELMLTMVLRDFYMKDKVK